MQRPQYTHDAAFKYALWRKLLADEQAQRLAQQRSPREAEEGPSEFPLTAAQCHVDAHVARVAFRAVHELLPRRTYEPCCLCGSCLPTSSRGGASPFVHTALHPGRPTVALIHGVRDEDCFCLAHHISCLGTTAASGRLRLRLRGYRSSAGNGKDPCRGLRCLLRHNAFSTVHISHVDSTSDGEIVVRELLALLYRQWPPPTSSGERTSLHVPHGLREVHLESVAAPARCLCDAFTSLAVRGCALTALSLQHSSLGSDVAAVAALAAALPRFPFLCSLSLQGNKSIGATGWATLAGSMAACPALRSLDVSQCGWNDETLRLFLRHLGQLTLREATVVSSQLAWDERDAEPEGFGARGEGFFLDLSGNPALQRVWSLLASDAPPGLRDALAGLALAENNLDGDAENAVAAFFAAFPSVRSLNVGMATLSASNLQRLTRSLAELSGRTWACLDMQALPHLPAPVLRRVTQLRYQEGHGALLLCGTDLRDGLLVKANMAACLGSLCELNLSSCRLHDEDAQQLASALEKAAPTLPLRCLRLGYNELGTDKRRAETALSYLCKALRAAHAPCLRTLDLGHNAGLPVRPVLALTEQVSKTLQELVLSATPLAEEAAACAMLMAAVMRRQRGPLAFARLDLRCVNAEAELLISNREQLDWLWRQAAFRFIYKE